MTDAKFRIGFLVFPGMTQLDFTGPAEVVARMPDAEISLVWKSLDPIRSDNGIRFVPDATIADDVSYDMICVPGGFACTDLMVDPKILDWLRRQAETAAYITSVCTGSLVLAAAGLLKGYKAGCHWAWAEYLEKFGATATRERVVIDRNRITAGGVTSGIDFGFTIVAERCGRDVAEQILLSLEYDPAPLAGGVPEAARPEILDKVQRRISKRNGEGDRIARINEAAAALVSA